MLMIGTQNLNRRRLSVHPSLLFENGHFQTECDHAHWFQEKEEKFSHLVPRNHPLPEKNCEKKVETFFARVSNISEPTSPEWCKLDCWSFAKSVQHSIYIPNTRGWNNYVSFSLNLALPSSEENIRNLEKNCWRSCLI